MGTFAESASIRIAAGAMVVALALPLLLGRWLGWTPEGSVIVGSLLAGVVTVIFAVGLAMEKHPYLGLLLVVAPACLLFPPMFALARSAVPVFGGATVMAGLVLVALMAHPAFRPALARGVGRRTPDRRTRRTKSPAPRRGMRM